MTYNECFESVMGGRSAWRSSWDIGRFITLGKFLGRKEDSVVEYRDNEVHSYKPSVKDIIAKDWEIRQ